MDRVGTVIGHIHVVSRLGSGGTGDVYEGFDQRLKRRVALKELRADRFSREARARFLREARILSRLDDPRICRIHEYLDLPDADLLVLELVEGRTLEALITDGPALDRATKLRIAERIAEALVRAHAAGVVHRDLKPANVMLRGDGEVKVLDFGIAFSPEPEEPPAAPPSLDLLSEESRETALFRTRIGGLIGTVAYMSPEQARGQLATPASDLYSFGLLLQELFTGRRAYPRDLPVPSLLVEVAAGRHLPALTVDPPPLARLIERLESLDPNARPSAAEALATIRHLRDAPRRRLRLAAAALVVLTVTGAVAKHTLDLRRERNAAVEARSRAETARRDELRARREAEEVADFLAGLFRVSAPGEARGRTITARELLERGAERIPARLAGQPEVQARMMRTIGRVYRELGLYDEAEKLLVQALAIQRDSLGEEDPEVGDSLLSLAVLYDIQARRDQAREAVERAIAIQARAGAAIGEAQGWNVRGEIERHAGDLDAAVAAYARASAVLATIPDGAPDDPILEASILNNLAGVHWRRKDLDAAEPLLARVSEIEETELGADHPRFARSLNNQGLLALERGELDAAEALFRRALAIKEKVLGEDHPELASTLYNLGDVLRKADRPADAEPLFRRALALDEAAGGPDHPNVAYSLTGLAHVLGDLGRVADAEAAYRRALAIFDAAAPGHPDRDQTVQGLASLLRETGREEEAARLAPPPATP